MKHFRTFIYPSGKYHIGYTKYVGWSFFSNIIVSIEGVLSTHSMLSAISINDSEAVRTANYIGKDIIGQIGSLAYMSKMGQSVDKESKKFFVYSNIIQQTSYITTCMTPFFPSHFLWIAGGANIATNISFTGFGAINAKCIQKLAQDNNVGEIYSKISVINTIGSSLGMILGIKISAIVPDQETRVLLVPILGLLRTYTYHKAIEDILD